MCADGLADDLDFDDEEFIGGLSYHNRIIYRRRNTKNLLLRAWILVQFKNLSLIMILFGMQSGTMLTSPVFCPILRLDLE